MVFSWIVGVSILVVIIFLVIWCLFGIKKQKFTFAEIGNMSFSQETDQKDVLSSSPYFSVLTLAVIRLIIGIFAFGTLIYRLMLGPAHGVPAMCWFTVWNWTLLTVYFISSPFMTFIIMTDRCNCKSLKIEKLINFTRMVIWIIFECLVSLVLFIDIVVWCFNHNYDELLQFTEFTMHSINFIFVYMEVIISDTPLGNMYHSLFALFLAMFYTIFAWIIYAAFNIPWPYPFVDFTNPFNGILILVIAIIIFICWCIAYGLKNFCVNRVLRGEREDNGYEMETDKKTQTEKTTVYRFRENIISKV